MMPLIQHCAVALVTLAIGGVSVAGQTVFDHAYRGYGPALGAHVAGARVDYARLQANRAGLDQAVAAFGAVARPDERSWTRAERMAFWINAYNAFMLRSIIDHYPIRGSWPSFYPKNSIRQIDGVFTGRKWSAAGRSLTLDDIEHEVLRREFQDPRIHFAINCASIGCPPLAAEPYVAARLDAQLDAAATRYLASDRRLVLDRGTLRLSKIFKWFGGDFEARFTAAGPAGRSDTDRALLAVVAKYGPPAAQDAARRPGARLAYLDYDWSLNDTATAR